jgi:hypothetical protein
MKSKNKKTAHCGVIHHTRILATIKEPRENFFTGNGISHFVDPDSPLSLGM